MLLSLAAVTDCSPRERRAFRHCARASQSTSNFQSAWCIELGGADANAQRSDDLSINDLLDCFAWPDASDVAAAEARLCGDRLRGADLSSSGHRGHGARHLQTNERAAR